MSEITQNISSLGDLPDIADPSTFEPRMNALVTSALPGLRTEINTWAGQANTMASELAALSAIAALLVGSGGSVSAARAAIGLDYPGLAASVGSSALTISLKTPVGNDPTLSNPVVVPVRSATLSSGAMNLRSVTAAQSITIPSTATMGQSNGVAARLWVALIDNAGTLELAVINTQLGSGQIHPVNESGLISTTALGTGSDSAGVWYSTAARSNVPFRLIGYIESTQATAGTWASAPAVIQPMGPGVRRPGEVVQVVCNATGAAATGTTVLPADDTIPQITEGDQYMTQAITPTSAINTVEVNVLAYLATNAAAGTGVTAALFQDSTAGALAAALKTSPGTGYMNDFKVEHTNRAATTSATTFRVRGGASAAGTTTFNGTGGGRQLGGVLYSYLKVTERMA